MTKIKIKKKIIYKFFSGTKSAMFLSLQKQPVVWPENRQPGIVTKLEASDHDSDANGPPFEFNLDNTASPDIHDSFRISSKSTHQI